MRYYLDCEFNGMGGRLLSLSLVREDGKSLYLISLAPYEPLDWVAANVIPILDAVPKGVSATRMAQGHFALAIERFFTGDRDPIIITDWPDDIKYFCECALTGPGTMIDVSSLKFEMHRVDAYPTDLPGAIRHNAYWDAMALRHKLQGST